ncbi:ACP S-malonyltransferase [Immundisolibacter cernigliae]|uniref:Malonyl CoA-acyl carrier protein transacylase n=1 Tax=Immundisolibacter cernigliae TaxID=1810504 RepID=A0A1B1YRY0_9GAMM|nr:ACP S-malonyltransferase [Immundisolibacter cernigliae]ANX03558.1 malonyl CoA-acyl carrier protein transacylase [Immundisolibacter cernigliae]
MTLALVFPGQGSQSVGMLAELAGEFAQVEQTFAEASEALGYDLWRLIQDGPDSELQLTAVTQPAMLSAGVAVWRVWQAAGGPTPALMAGHSLGEYSALVCAGALPFEQAVRLVRQRGEYMQQAVPVGSGAMAAVLGLDRAAVEAACATAARPGETVAVANYNAPLQSVIAGHAAAVARASAAAQSAGAKRVVPLPVSAPFHCSLMRPAADALAPALEAASIRSPEVPVINNVDVTAASEPAAIRDALIRQIYSPVRWVEVIEAMHARGVTHVVECGPGKVLAGLSKRICGALESLAVQDPASLRQTLAALG